MLQALLNSYLLWLRIDEWLSAAKPDPQAELQLAGPAHVLRAHFAPEGALA